MLSMLSMRYHQQVWFYCGLWHVPGQPAWYIWYTWFLTIFVYFLFPLLITIQLFYTTNIEEFTDILLIWPTAAFGIKAALIALNRTKIQRLFAILEQMDEFVRLDQHRAIVMHQNRESHRLVWFFSVEYYVSITTHLFVALLTAGPVLMWPAWFPLNYVDNYVVYLLFNIYLYMSSLLNGYVFTSLDVYGVALYKLLGAHLDILCEQLAALGHNPNDEGVNRQTAVTGKKGFDRAKWATAAAQRATLQRRNVFELHQCIQYHTLCSSFAELLNSIISLQYFLQFGMSIAVVCGSEFKLMLLDPFEEPVEYVNVVLYVLGLVFEIFLPCYIGSIVMAKSEQLLGAVYQSNWIEQTPVYKSSLLIFGERAKRRIAPKAGGLFALELPMFVSVRSRRRCIKHC